VLTEFFHRHKAEGHAELDFLLAVLRDELRSELRLPRAQARFKFYRAPIGQPDICSESSVTVTEPSPS
jgi:hypothetical protein